MAKIASPAIATASDPVQVSTGNFSDGFIDLSFGDLFGLDLTRSYNSTSTVEDIVGSRTHRSMFGRGWQLGFQVTAIERANRSVAVTLPSGTVALFLADNGGYERPADFNGELIAVGSTFELHMFNGGPAQFDSQGRMVRASSAKGESVTVTFGDIGQIEQVESSTGCGLRLTTTMNARSSRPAPSSTGPSTERSDTPTTATATWQLFTSADGETTRYLTDEDGRILTITDPTGVVVVTNSYDSRGRVMSQTTATGETSTFAYGDGVTGVDIAAEDDGATRTDTFSYSSDDQGYTIGITDPLGGTVSHDRDGRGMPFRARPDGNRKTDRRAPFAPSILSATS